MLLFRFHNERDLCSHRVDRIHNIIILFKRKFVCIFRQKKTLVRAHLCIRIDRQNAILHYIHLILPDCISRCNNLSIEIGQAHLVIIDQIKGTYSTSY